MTDIIYNFDWNVLNAIQMLRCTFLDVFLSWLTVVGEGGACWIVVCAVMLLFKKTRRCGAAMALCLVLCLIFGNFILKPIVARPRPYMLNEEIAVTVPLSDSYSFPSGHTYSSIGSAVVIWYYLKCKAGMVAVPAALLISFSRLYFRMHFMTDVFGGAVMGVIIACVSIFVVNKICERFKC